MIPRYLVFFIIQLSTRYTVSGRYDMQRMPIGAPWSLRSPRFASYIVISWDFTTRGVSYVIILSCTFAVTLWLIWLPFAYSVGCCGVRASLWMDIQSWLVWTKEAWHIPTRPHYITHTSFPSFSAFVSGNRPEGGWLPVMENHKGLVGLDMGRGVGSRWRFVFFPSCCYIE